MGDCTQSVVENIDCVLEYLDAMVPYRKIISENKTCLTQLSEITHSVVTAYAYDKEKVNWFYLYFENNLKELFVYNQATFKRTRYIVTQAKIVEAGSHKMSQWSDPQK